MTRILLPSILSALTALATAETTALPDGWFFIKRDVGLANPQTQWSPVTVPHTWNAEDGRDGGGTCVQSRDGYYRGPGWYRRPIKIDESLKGKRLFLRFEGVGSVADIYINRIHQARHQGAFGAFCVEITHCVQYGAENEIGVRADNDWRSDLPPLSGDFTIFGGIYRPVWLLVRDSACITPLDHGSSGVFITQKDVSKTGASVSVRTKIDNSGDTAGLEVKCVIRDADGKELATATNPVNAAATAEVTQNIQLANPRLWNGRKDPYLHSVEVSLLRGGAVIDSTVQPLGLRFYHVDPEKGFFLNGESYKLHGVNRHQDRDGKGWAVSNADHEEDIRLICEMGANAVRLAHYPHASHVYELCDKAGLMVWAEAPNVDCISSGPEYAANARQQLIELIRQHGNHPSIFCWSLFNEMFHRDTPDAIPLLTELKALAKQEDPGRPTAGAVNKEREDICMVADLLAFNAYPGWYGKGAHRMGNTLAAYNALGGKRGVGVAEYGGGASISHHEQNPKQPVPVSHWHPEQWQTVVHEANYKSIRNMDACWGSFLWNMFDFASEWRDEGDTAGINDKGLVTYDRKTRKDTFFFYKANWSDEPVVYLTSRRHVERTDADTPVKVYSNAAEVSLKVNGKPIGTAKVSDLGIASWKSVRLEAGDNTITAEAVIGGKPVTDTCVWKLVAKPAPKSE
jgi:beta-galactosidase